MKNIIKENKIKVIIISAILVLGIALIVAFNLNKSEPTNTAHKVKAHKKQEKSFPRKDTKTDKKEEEKVVDDTADNQVETNKTNGGANTKQATNKSTQPQATSQPTAQPQQSQPQAQQPISQPQAQPQQSQPQGMTPGEWANQAVIDNGGCDIDDIDF